MKKNIRALTPFVFSLIIISVSLSCATTHRGGQTPGAIPYPVPYPDSVALTFLPGIVSMDSSDFGSSFSPDGKSFYFARSKNGLSDIYVTHHDGQKWTEPVLAPFSQPNYSEADACFAPNGNLYFISNKPRNLSDTLKDYDIWFTTPLSGGRWSEPENMESVNSDANEFYISFTGNANMYFSSSRKGGFGEEDIYVSRFINGKYMSPENLGAAINSGKSEYDPCISAGEDLIIFASSNRDDAFGKADLYCSTINASSKWLPAQHLDKDINTVTREYCPYFTSDGAYFFFSSQGDVKWISAGFLKRKVVGLFAVPSAK
jgi:Tol biopolymer transport system component